MCSRVWIILISPWTGGYSCFFAASNCVYGSGRALAVLDCSPTAFLCLNPDYSEYSGLAFLRCGDSETDTVVVVCNFTPVPRAGYRVGVPAPGFWQEILNSDAAEYAGSGLGNLGGLVSVETPCQGQPHSIEALLPPLSVLYFRRVK